VTQPAPMENGNMTIKHWQVSPNWFRVSLFLHRFFLLFYKSGRLHIVASTVNLLDHDWRDIENTTLLSNP